MPIIEANGINLYYEIHGSKNDESLIFTNGIFANTLSWLHQIPVFSKKYKVILYDMRGQGQSDHPEGEYTLELHAKDQKALLDGLNIERVNHIGISYGAEVGLVLAWKYPEMVKSLVVCSGVTHLEPYLLHISHLWRIACVKADPMLFFHATVPINFSPTYVAVNKEILEQAKERYKHFDYPAFDRLMDAFLKLRITSDQLSQIEVPTCIIAGEKDIIKPPNPYSLYMHKHILNSELHIIPESGHVVIWEKPEEFNSVVLGFLEKVIN